MENISPTLYVNMVVGTDETNFNINIQKALSVGTIAVPF
jgi:hypothetical protein